VSRATARRTPPHLLRAALGPLERAHDAGTDLLDAFGTVDEARRVLGALLEAREPVPEGVADVVAARLGLNPEAVPSFARMARRLLTAIETRERDAGELLAAHEGRAA
jgi:hypothetical protein